MPLCSSDCVITMPVGYGGNCGLIQKPAGIKQLIFIACDVDVASLDFTLQQTWDDLCTQGKLAVSGNLLAEKAKGSFTKKKIYSCSPEVTIGGEKTLAFQDYNGSANDATDEFAFWNTIQSDSSKFYMFYLTCDNWLYGAVSNFTIEVDEVIPNDNKELRYIDGAIMWNDKNMLEPVKVSANVNVKCDSSSISIMP
jgi:hypothetical protein